MRPLYFVTALLWSLVGLSAGAKLSRPFRTVFLFDVGNKFVWVPAPSTTVDAPAAVTIRVVDDSDNLLSSYSGYITVEVIWSAASLS